MNICGQVFVQFSVLFSVYVGVELLDHVVLSPQQVHHFYTPAPALRRFHFLYIILVFFILAILAGMK